MKRALQGRGQRLQEVEQCGGAGEGGDAQVHDPVVTEESAAQRQQDQCDGQGIEEHQHRNGVFDDLRQAEVRDAEGEDREEDRPAPVGQGPGEHPGECVGAAGDQSDGGLEAGAGDGQRQHQLACGPQVVPGDLGQGDTAVLGEIEQAAGLRAHQDRGGVDQRHQKARERAGAQHIPRDGRVVAHAHGTDDVDHHDAEGQACDCVHGAVALHECGGQRMALVGGDRLHCRGRCAGAAQRGDHQDRQEDQEQRIDDLADPHRDVRRTQRQKQHQCKERQRKDQQRKPLGGPVAQHGQHARGEGRGRTPWDGEEGADGQVEQAGEGVAIAAAHLGRQRLQAVRVGVADGRHAQYRDAHGGDDEADHRGQCVLTRHLAQVHREDQVPRTKEHAEQRAGHQDALPVRQLLLHFTSPRLSGIYSIIPLAF